MQSLAPSDVAAYGRTGVTLRFASRSEVGLVRANNEDTVVATELSGGQALAPGKLGPAGVLFGICDGMGGAAAGEVASRLAAKVVAEELTRVPIDASVNVFVAAAETAVGSAGEAIRQHAARHAARKGMGTTCTVAAVRGGLLVVAHVGDSRLYLFRGGALRQVTRDHSWENELLRQGRVKPSELGELERGKAIVQAVGTTEELRVEVAAFELRRGDLILVCSDGLSGMVSDDGLRGVLQRVTDLEAASDELVQRALQGGGRDNLSFVLARFDGSGLRELEDEPAVVLPRVSRRPWSVAALGVLLAGVAAFGGRAVRDDAAAVAGQPAGEGTEAAARPVPGGEPPRAVAAAPAAVVEPAAEVLEAPAASAVVEGPPTALLGPRSAVDAASAPAAAPLVRAPRGSAAKRPRGAGARAAAPEGRGAERESGLEIARPAGGGPF